MLLMQKATILRQAGWILIPVFLFYGHIFFFFLHFISCLIHLQRYQILDISVDVILNCLYELSSFCFCSRFSQIKTSNLRMVFAQSLCCIVAILYQALFDCQLSFSHHAWILNCLPFIWSSACRMDNKPESKAKSLNLSLDLPELLRLHH